MTELLLLFLFADSAAPAAVDFQRDVAPLLVRCQGCHGGRQQLGGLKLESRGDALKGGKSGPAIVPGNSAGSRMIQLVSGAEKNLLMPPVGDRLTPPQIATLGAWIDQGAKWPEPRGGHWAFNAPQRPPIPQVKNAGWVRNPIDALVLARLESENLAPSAEADKRTLIRRASLDLTGLPPTREESAAFAADTRPDAYERLVDRLLASPHYGEKWARHWLDLARYADSDGYEKDMFRPNAWRYRHWLIETLNRDIPFDQFTVQTIAGDMLPNATVEQKIATGWHRNTLTNREGGVDPEMFRYEQVLDRTMNLGTVWLGLTAGCAQCHDHKYDPIRQKDFYQLFAYFNRAEEMNIDAPLPGEAGPYYQALPAYRKARGELLAAYNAPELQAEWEKRLVWTIDNPSQSLEWDFALGVMRVMVDNADRLLKLGLERRNARQNREVTDHFLTWYNSVVTKERLKELKWEDLRDKVKKLEASLPLYSEAPTLMEDPSPRTSCIHIRGEFKDCGETVQPATPAFLHKLPAGSAPNRLSLARWLMASDNPLTARVTVNRFWSEFFGRGIVRTTEDFGTQGERPSHPELLDWLAVEFRESGWSMKRMHKLIAMSATYRQSSAARPELVARDPSNLLLARQSRVRLSAEQVRDVALAASGLLNPAIGGRSIRPPQPQGVTALGYSPIKWEVSPGAEAYRRGLYIHFQRTTPYPMLMNFDEPDSVTTCARRQRSNTPLQALNLLNDPVFLEAAQGLAVRMIHEKPASLTDRINYGFELALGRDASPREKDRLSGYFEQQKRIFENDPKAADAMMPLRLENVPPVEAATWAAVARTLLNLDEFMTRE